MNRRRSILALLCMIFLFLPQYVFASVLINEIAWMGTVESGTNEWIELLNNTNADVDLSGWRIEAEDGSPVITLSGTIASNGYYLIERTDDLSVPTISADIVAPFGSGLSNNGETLWLKDSSNAISDTVVGGDGWGNIGGDNVTKETAQRTQNSWVTGTPTPRAQNVSDGIVLGASTVSSQVTESNNSGNTILQESVSNNTSVTKSSYVSTVYPRENMTVSAGIDQRAFVGQKVSFHALALGLYDESLPYATYRWNFGDGAVGIGVDVSHVYQFPGEYTAVVHVWNGPLEYTDRAIISITEQSIVVSRSSDGSLGFVELQNKSEREVDISGWVLYSSSQNQIFIFPDQTFIPSKRSVIFPNANTKLDGGTLSLFLSLDGVSRMREDLTQMSASQGTTAPQTPTVAPDYPSSPSESVVHREKDLGTAEKTESSKSEAVRTFENSTATGSAAATVLWEREPATPARLFGFDLSTNLSWLLIFFGVLLLILAGVVVAKSGVDEPSLADEYAIVSDMIEDGDEEPIGISRY